MLTCCNATRRTLIANRRFKPLLESRPRGTATLQLESIQSASVAPAPARNSRIAEFPQCFLAPSRPRPRGTAAGIFETARRRAGRASAKRLYALGDQSQKEIAKSLGVSQSTVANWLSRTLKEEKERKRDKAFALWLACHTQDEIAAAVDMTRQAIAVWEDEFAKKLEVDIFANSPDFEVPIYNVWKQQTKTAGVSHFGNSEVRWLDNLLYLYTNPADIVVDPFAGIGRNLY